MRIDSARSTAALMHEGRATARCCGMPVRIMTRLLPPGRGPCRERQAITVAHDRRRYEAKKRARAIEYSLRGKEQKRRKLYRELIAAPHPHTLTTLRWSAAEQAAVRHCRAGMAARRVARPPRVGAILPAVDC